MPAYSSYCPDKTEYFPRGKDIPHSRCGGDSCMSGIPLRAYAHMPPRQLMVHINTVRPYICTSDELIIHPKVKFCNSFCEKYCKISKFDTLSHFRVFCLKNGKRVQKMSLQAHFQKNFARRLHVSMQPAGFL